MLMSLQKENPALVSRAQRSGRLQSVLATDAPLILIVPDDDEHMLSAALRVAHDLNVYHKLDAEILASSVARAKMDSHSLGLGSIILFGTPRDEFVRDILDLNETPIGVREGMLLVNGMSFDASELGELHRLNWMAASSLTSTRFCRPTPAPRVGTWGDLTSSRYRPRHVGTSPARVRTVPYRYRCARLVGHWARCQGPWCSCSAWGWVCIYHCPRQRVLTMG
jgi:hypothetical protein